VGGPSITTLRTAVGFSTEVIGSDDLVRYVRVPLIKKVLKPAANKGFVFFGHKMSPPFE
jgi:hypothetical protein